MRHRARLICLVFLVVGSWGGICGAQTTPGDPTQVGAVALEVEGIMTGYFQEITSIGSENEVVEHMQTDPGTGETTTQKVPGRLRVFDITLSRGITANLDVWEWRQMVVDQQIDNARKDVSIVLYDQALEEVARWNGTACWPSQVDGRFESGDPFATETLVLACEEIERVVP